MLPHLLIARTISRAGRPRDEVSALPLFYFFFVSRLSVHALLRKISLSTVLNSYKIIK